jgi:hypothetical protein
MPKEWGRKWPACRWGASLVPRRAFPCCPYLERASMDAAGRSAAVGRGQSPTGRFSAGVRPCTACARQAASAVREMPVVAGTRRWIGLSSSSSLASDAFVSLPRGVDVSRNDHMALLRAERTGDGIAAAAAAAHERWSDRLVVTTGRFPTGPRQRSGKDWIGFGRELSKCRQGRGAAVAGD